MQMTEIQRFEVCVVVVVGYASYSYCNEISQSQVQLYVYLISKNASVEAQCSGGRNGGAKLRIYV